MVFSSQDCIMWHCAYKMGYNLGRALKYLLLDFTKYVCKHKDGSPFLLWAAVGNDLSESFALKKRYL